MRIDQLKEMLKAWGHATVNRHSMGRAERTTVHVMTKVRDHAPGTRVRAERDLIGRDGYSRRARMGAAASADVRLSMAAVPMWACDPIPAANDASRPHDNPVIAVDLGIPDDLRWVDDAIARMRRQNPLRHLIVETEYTVAAGQQAKSRIVAEQYDGELTYSMYRRELEKAHDWLLWERNAAA